MSHQHSHQTSQSINSAAASATLHCLTGCAIGEITGLIIGSAAGLSAGVTIVLALLLAFVFGYTLSTLPLVRSGLSFLGALQLVLAADTLSILVMELVDNLVMVALPGAMEAGLLDTVFWVGMMVALTTAFLAAFPVNRYQLQRGKGHALTHEYHHGAGQPSGFRRWIPALPAGALAAAIAAFMFGGLVAASAPEQDAAHDSSVIRDEH